MDTYYRLKTINNLKSILDEDPLKQCNDLGRILQETESSIIQPLTVKNSTSVKFPG